MIASRLGVRSGLRWGTAGILAVVAAVACSSDDGGEPGQPAIGERAAALTGSCAASTFGLPCDPDGAGDAGGPLTECQGVCWLGTDGNPACLTLATVGIANLNGQPCGDATGSSCTKSCQSGVCADQFASAGAACIPTTGGNSCQGRCTAVGPNITATARARAAGRRRTATTTTPAPTTRATPRTAHA